MSAWRSFLKSNFIIKLKSWEYWPFGIVQFPVIIYWLWLSVRARSFLFFSASNPSIPMGGMFGESKFDILCRLPSSVVPATILITIPASAQQVIASMHNSGLNFPVIFKPDIGERGHLVKKVEDEADVERYLTKVKSDFLVQEFVDLPLEFGIFYTRFPEEKKGEVTSVIMKEMLSVTGDGRSTLKELIFNKDRAKLQWENLRTVYHNRLGEILPMRQTLELVSIGNHARGTKFLDGSHLINEKLSETFDNISRSINGFYFGRYDLRCATREDLYEGKVKIMELNGCGAEPAHIYHPGFSLVKAVGVLLRHWKNIFIIAGQNRKRGTEYISVREAYHLYRKFKTATS
jgi:hypothetical protein